MRKGFLLSGIFVFILIFFSFFYFAKFNSVEAVGGSEDTVAKLSGQAWSAATGNHGIGWIDFGNTVNETDSNYYGVKITSSNGTYYLRGQAWTGAHGWLSFDAGDSQVCGNEARVSAEGKVTGWAKFLFKNPSGANSGKDETCVSLDGSNYGLQFTADSAGKIPVAKIEDVIGNGNVSYLTGQAWSGLGAWISFNCSNNNSCASQGGIDYSVKATGQNPVPVSNNAAPIISPSSPVNVKIDGSDQIFTIKSSGDIDLKATYYDIQDKQIEDRAISLVNGSGNISTYLNGGSEGGFASYKNDQYGTGVAVITYLAPLSKNGADLAELFGLDGKKGSSPHVKLTATNKSDGKNSSVMITILAKDAQLPAGAISITTQSCTDRTILEKCSLTASKKANWTSDLKGSFDPNPEISTVYTTPFLSSSELKLGPFDTITATDVSDPSVKSAPKKIAIHYPYRLNSCLNTKSGTTSTIELSWTQNFSDPDYGKSTALSPHYLRVSCGDGVSNMSTIANQISMGSASPSFDNKTGKDVDFCQLFTIYDKANNSSVNTDLVACNSMAPSTTSTALRASRRSSSAVHLVWKDEVPNGSGNYTFKVEKIKLTPAISTFTPSLKNSTIISSVSSDLKINLGWTNATTWTPYDNFIEGVKGSANQSIRSQVGYPWKNPSVLSFPSIIGAGSTRQTGSKDFSATADNLDELTTYYFRTKACSRVKPSDYSPALYSVWNSTGGVSGTKDPICSNALPYDSSNYYLSSTTTKPLAPTISNDPYPNGFSKDVTTSSITFQWQDNSKKEDGYEVWRQDGSGTSALLAAIASSSYINVLPGVGTIKGSNNGMLVFTNTGLSANTSYTYSVKAYGYAGDADCKYWSKKDCSTGSNPPKIYSNEASLTADTDFIVNLAATNQMNGVTGNSVTPSTPPDPVNTYNNTNGSISYEFDSNVSAQ